MLGFTVHSGTACLNTESVMFVGISQAYIRSVTYDPLIVESHSLTLYYPVLCCFMLLKHASQGSAESPIMSVRTFPSSEDHASMYSSSQLRYRSYFKPFLTFLYISLSEHLLPPFEYTILFHSTLTTTRLNYNLSGQLEIILCNYRPMSQTPSAA